MPSFPHRFVRRGCTEHIVIDHPEGSVRLDVAEGSLLRGRANITIQLDLRRATAAQLSALDRLLMMSGLRDPGRRRPAPPDRRLPRLVEALRVADALTQKASLAEIAAGLSLALAGRTTNWPGEGEHLKSAARRKVALACRLIDLGPQGVLHRRT